MLIFSLHCSGRVPNKYVVVTICHGNDKKSNDLHFDNHKRAPELVYSVLGVIVGPPEDYKLMNRWQNPVKRYGSAEKIENQRESLSVSYEDVCPKGSLWFSIEILSTKPQNARL